MKEINKPLEADRKPEIQAAGALSKVEFHKLYEDLKDYEAAAELDKLEYYFVMTAIFALQHLLAFWGIEDGQVEAQDQLEEGQNV